MSSLTESSSSWIMVGVLGFLFMLRSQSLFKLSWAQSMSGFETWSYLFLSMWESETVSLSSFSSSETWAQSMSGFETWSQFFEYMSVRNHVIDLLFIIWNRHRVAIISNGIYRAEGLIGDVVWWCLQSSNTCTAFIQPIQLCELSRPQWSWLQSWLVK